VREALQLDRDSACAYVFEFGSQKHKRYSDDAIRKVREFVALGKLDEAVSAYNGA
jgi:hypothetical protein